MKNLSCFIVLFVVFNVTDINAQDLDSSFLFKIERSRDADFINYYLNTNKRGVINLNNPIDIHWIKETQNHKKEPLTWIQNNYAYGIKLINNETNSNENNLISFCFACYNQLIIDVKKVNSKTYKAYTFIDNKEIEIEKIFIQFGGGTFMMPEIEHIKVIGAETTNQQLISTIIQP